MLFTLKNVYNNRELFEEQFSMITIDYVKINRLKEASTKKDFMQVIYDNFQAINEQINYFVPEYKYCTNFIGNFAVIGDSYGNRNILKKDGTLLFEEKFKDYYIINNKIICLKNQYGRWGILSSKGTWYFDPFFDDIENANDDIVNVKINGLWGYVKVDDKKKNYINKPFLIKPKYENSSSFRNGFAKVRKNESSYYLIDTAGNEFEDDGSWDDPDGADYDDEYDSSEDYMDYE